MQKNGISIKRMVIYGICVFVAVLIGTNYISNTIAALAIYNIIAVLIAEFIIIKLKVK